MYALECFLNLYHSSLKQRRLFICFISSYVIAHDVLLWFKHLKAYPCKSITTEIKIESWITNTLNRYCTWDHKKNKLIYQQPKSMNVHIELVFIVMIMFHDFRIRQHISIFLDLCIVKCSTTFEAKPISQWISIQILYVLCEAIGGYQKNCSNKFICTPKLLQGISSDTFLISHFVYNYL